MSEEYELIECPNCCRKAVPFDEWESHQCNFCGTVLDECVECEAQGSVTVDYHMDDPSMRQVIPCPLCDGWGLIEQ
jgi:hypothetical protein